jgi:hypothetical protein
LSLPSAPCEANQEEIMGRKLIFVIGVMTLVLTACNKSSPPPQKPVTPRSIAAIELPLRFAAP